MAGDDDGLDLESRGNRLTGAIDAVADLIGGQAMNDLGTSANDLCCLMRLIAAEAHVMHDTKFGPRPPLPANS